MTEYIKNGIEIIKQLKAHNYDAYFVGGFVRDYLLGIESDDIDITTSATPNEVIDCFDNVKETGKKYGSVTVLIDDYKYEVTTFRSEGKYIDKRRPSEVTFSSNVKDDIARRDFTINAFLMDENLNVIDYLNGQKDLDNNIIRTINDPDERFKEDALRILRAIRFVASHGFDIEKTTKKAIEENRQLVESIAIERVMVELDKIFKGTYRTKAFNYLIETSLSKSLYGLHEGILYLKDYTESLYPLEIFIIAFIKGEYDDVWRFSNNQKRLIEKVMNLHEITKEDYFNKHILFAYSYDVCKLVNHVNVVLGYHDQQKELDKMNEEMPVHDVCDLKFKGQDILQLTDLKNRRVIGLVIDDLLELVISGEMPNKYEPLKAYALKRIKELQDLQGGNHE